MNSKTVVGSICYPDDTNKHTKVLIDLLRHYDETEGGSGNVLLEISVDGDDFIIKVMKGFDCIYLPLKDVKDLVNIEEEK